MMKTKWILPALMALALGAIALASVGCKSVPHKSYAAREFTCPRHPEVVFGSPTVCATCGMKLVEKK